jgi:uncharacterized protein YpmS
MTKMLVRLLPLALLLAAASLACQAPLKAIPTPTPTLIPASTEDALQFEQRVTEAVKQLEDTGTITLTITESQLTAFIIQQLQSQNDVPFKDPQVLLRNNQIEVSGTVTSGIINAPGSMVLVPVVDQGNLKINVQSAKIGSVPVPQGTLDNLSTLINQNIDSLISVNGTPLEIQSLQVSDGQMTITGKAR